MTRFLTASVVLCLLLTAGHSAKAQTDQPDKPWRVRLSAGGGWNSNAGVIGDSISNGTFASAVPFIRDKGTAFGRLTFDGSYDVVDDGVQLLTVGYGLHSDTYEGDTKEVNGHQHTLWAGYSRKLSDQLSLSFQVADTYVNVGNDGYSNTIYLEPSVYWKPCEDFGLELRYTFADVEHYEPPVAPGFERDGQYHELAVTGFFDIPKTDLKFRLGYRYRSTLTDGSPGLYEYDSNVFTVGVTAPIFWDITLDASYTLRIDDGYGIGVGGGATREDDAHFYSLMFERPIDENARVYLRYDFIEAKSNGTLFDYRQHVVAAGVIWDF